ncbi:MAG: cobalt-precorrin-5B (C(1))-methyltransferase CbiD [Hespellia sp.]|nr:cobalt-precorrin-5B (C(1))-methyltransferase CbiD [Hespellia sp.]
MADSRRLEDYYIYKNHKKLQYGYTTGTCSAAAAKAAAEMLFGGRQLAKVEITVPFGIDLELEICETQIREDGVTCAVKKYAGDDPDVTNGVLVYATVTRQQEKGIWIDGGIGVGRVTKKGLEQPVGQAAINKTPRAMIFREMEEVCNRYEYEGGISVTISIPEGVELAKRTFNPRLGIEGGISVLGTTGIVVPMSEEALIKSIEVEMGMRLSDGDCYLLATPGNYGATYLRDHTTLDFSRNIQCSNYIGETIDMAVNKGAKGLLFVSHIGKFAKVAAGIMNTHSRAADARAEVMAACAIRAGANLETAKAILETVTTDEALGLIKAAGLLEKTMVEMIKKIGYYLDRRAYGQIVTGAVIFSNEYGYLGQTESAAELMHNLEAR